MQSRCPVVQVWRAKDGAQTAPETTYQTLASEPTTTMERVKDTVMEDAAQPILHSREQMGTSKIRDNNALASATLL